jgi:hypothetical protein
MVPIPNQGCCIYCLFHTFSLSLQFNQSSHSRWYALANKRPQTVCGMPFTYILSLFYIHPLSLLHTFSLSFTYILSFFYIHSLSLLHTFSLSFTYILSPYILPCINQSSYSFANNSALDIYFLKRDIKVFYALTLHKGHKKCTVEMPGH